jgi:hypothetical protein
MEEADDAATVAVDHGDATEMIGAEADAAGEAGDLARQHHRIATEGGEAWRAVAGDRGELHRGGPLRRATRCDVAALVCCLTHNLGSARAFRPLSRARLRTMFPAALKERG